MEQRPKVSFKQLVLLVGFLIIVVVFFMSRGGSTTEVEITEVLRMAEQGQLTKIQVAGNELTVTSNDGNRFNSRKEPGVSILELLDQRGIVPGVGSLEVEIRGERNRLASTLINLLPLLLFVGLILFVIRRGATGGLNQALRVGRSKARQVSENRPDVSFDDVAGSEEAKQDLVEVVQFLSDPDKFTKLGAKIPKGVLLVGPPGTGKTLISKAVAGEAEVLFFSTSGSEFVEMFVGVGASRVRDLFVKAKQDSPAVVFIDEIDAVGRHRGAGIGGGNDEREQTLNQILVEMDGFDERTNVIVIAATNRPDILDPALIRPGRFDRRITLNLPDVREREAILASHIKGKPVDDDLELRTIAKETPGFSGADLANLVNEAVILAARQTKNSTGAAEFEEAIDRVLAGPARKSRKISKKERRTVAFHEAGHAVVASQLEDADPLHKVTIVPRGVSGGHTRLLPEEDRMLWSKKQFKAMLAVMMGGQVAEQLMLGDITTGASNDLENATEMARKMVTEYGMSDGLGPQTFDSGETQVFLGKSLNQGRNYSDAIAEQIDKEVDQFLSAAYDTAQSLVGTNKELLMKLADKLLIDETVQGDELRAILGAA